MSTNGIPTTSIPQDNLVVELEAIITGQLKDERPAEKIKILEAISTRFKTLCIEVTIMRLNKK